MKKKILLLISLCVAYNATHASFKQSTRLAALAAQARKLAASAAQQTKRVWQSTRTKINEAYAHPKMQKLLERPGIIIVLPALVFNGYSVLKANQETKAYEAELDTMDRAENMTRFLKAQTIKDKPGFTITWDKPFPEDVQNLIKAVIYTCNIPGNYTITETPSFDRTEKKNLCVIAKEKNGTLHVTIECNSFLYKNLLDSTKKDTLQSWFLGAIFHELGHVSKMHGKQTKDLLDRNLTVVCIIYGLLSPMNIAKYKLLSTAQKLDLHIPIIQYFIGFYSIIFNQVSQEYEKQADLYACAHAPIEAIQRDMEEYQTRDLEFRQSIKDDITNQFSKLFPEKMLTQQNLDKSVGVTYKLGFFLEHLFSTHPTDTFRAKTFEKELQKRSKTAHTQLQTAVATSRLNTASIWK